VTPTADGPRGPEHDLVAGVRDAARRAASSSRPEAWITLRDAAAVEADGAAVAAELDRGDDLPLAGTTLAVKDNIDVAGTPTTAAHPAFATDGLESATVVARLTAAGAVVIGKTNLDQFATGLVGTRSPFGAVRNAIDPSRISGGSSSGSAVAVALGEVDAALGTDTAGSGRVPAALNAVVGLKPTRGLLSTVGVVPACRSIDCVSVFARSVATASAVLAAASGPDPADPWSRTAPLGTPIPGSGPLRIGVPRPEQVDALDDAARGAWDRAVRDLARLGPVVEIDLGPYLDAGELLYGSALVAERWDAVGPFLEAHPEGSDPTVAAVIGAARDLPAHQYAADIDRVRRHAADFAPVWDAVDVVAIPTVGEAPTLAEVAADPIGVNRRLGRFTNGCNLLDLCAAAVPAGTRDDGMPFGITFLGPAFADPVVATVAARFVGEPDPPLPGWAGATTIVVVGAHLRGQPLNGELVGRGAQFVASVRTAPSYRLAALPTVPPKPGLSRVRPDETGAAIAAELWRIPIDGFGDFVDAIPAPLGIGKVELADGTWHPGFICEGAALADAPDITAHGGWLAYLTTRPGATADPPIGR
jgi:allophanate hydrolase